MLIFLLGLIILIIGGKLLVKGASELSAMLKVPKLTIGLTVVAYGTSAPEVFTSVAAAVKAEAAIALGNIVGSNIFNSLFVLGFAALIRPISIHLKLLKIDVPIMIGISLLFWLLALTGGIGKVAAIFLLLMLILYTFLAIFFTRSSEKMAYTMPLWLQLLSIVAGLALLIFGAEWTVEGATEIAKKFSVSSRIIALSLVAIGTSLPELTTSMIAAFHKEPEIALGNVIGSNIFNILGVGGLAALIAPSKLEVSSQLSHFDIPIMVATTIVTLPLLFTGFRISRSEGAWLLGCYILYMLFLFLIPYQHIFTVAFLYFLLPISFVVIMITLYYHFKKS